MFQRGSGKNTGARDHELEDMSSFNPNQSRSCTLPVGGGISVNDY